MLTWGLSVLRCHGRMSGPQTTGACSSSVINTPGVADAGNYPCPRDRAGLAAVSATTFALFGGYSGFCTLALLILPVQADRAPFPLTCLVLLLACLWTDDMWLWNSTSTWWTCESSFRTCSTCPLPVAGCVCLRLRCWFTLSSSGCLVALHAARAVLAGSSTASSSVTPAYGAYRQYSAAVRPGARHFTALAWSPRTGSLFLFGGMSGGTNAVFNDLFEFSLGTRQYRWCAVAVSGQWSCCLSRGCLRAVCLRLRALGVALRLALHCFVVAGLPGARSPTAGRRALWARAAPPSAPQRDVRSLCLSSSLFLCV